MNWPRISYLTRYSAVLNSESTQCAQTFSQALTTIEDGFRALYAYTDAKLNNPTTTDVKKAAFVALCGGGVCEGALKTMISAINGGDLSTQGGSLGCDLAEHIY
jgi:1,6-anhydro-N-acetylmuramate kinase